MSIHNHIVKQIENSQLRANNTLYVIGVISNPVRFNSRLRLFKEWKAAMEKTPHVQLCVVEEAFGDRHFEITKEGNEWELQVRTHQILWRKENLINLAFKHLIPHNAQYIAWIDCDVFFHNQGWAQETMHQLQHYPLVQPWSDCVDLGPHGEVLHHFQSFCYVHRMGWKKQTHPSQPYKYAHSGYSWAATRYFWENVRGLMEFNIVGSADHVMAFGSIGQSFNAVHGHMTENYKKKCKEWEERACYVTRGDKLGYVKGLIEHRFHGPKRSRKYRERWGMFIDHKFDPTQDLHYDAQGLIYLKDKPQLEAEIFDYMKNRDEDSISTE